MCTNGDTIKRPTDKENMSDRGGRKRFAFCAPPAKRIQKIPKATELEAGFMATVSTLGQPLQLVPPPKIVVSRLSNPDLLIGFDIETHDWQEEWQKGRIGQFGWYTIKGESTTEFARIVQIGWAIGRADKAAPLRVKTALVKPDGFEISAKATKFHTISHATAAQEGRPLAAVLCDFMADVSEAHSRGGRVVAHNLEPGKAGR